MFSRRSGRRSFVFPRELKILYSSKWSNMCILSAHVREKKERIFFLVTIQTWQFRYSHASNMCTTTFWSMVVVATCAYITLHDALNQRQAKTLPTMHCSSLACGTLQNAQIVKIKRLATTYYFRTHIISYNEFSSLLLRDIDMSDIIVWLDAVTKAIDNAAM